MRFCFIVRSAAFALRKKYILIVWGSCICQWWQSLSSETVWRHISWTVKMCDIVSHHSSYWKLLRNSLCSLTTSAALACFFFFFCLLTANHEKKKRKRILICKEYTLNFCSQFLKEFDDFVEIETFCSLLFWLHSCSSWEGHYIWIS